MLAWLCANLINIILIALIVLVVALLIRGMVRDKKAGKSSCGGCSACGKCCAMNAAAARPRERKKEL